jgi:hypothetical protein
MAAGTLHRMNRTGDVLVRGFYDVDNALYDRNRSYTSMQRKSNER